jgi:hypothetical protein
MWISKKKKKMYLTREKVLYELMIVMLATGPFLLLREIFRKSVFFLVVIAATAPKRREQTVPMCLGLLKQLME